MVKEPVVTRVALSTGITLPYVSVGSSSAMPVLLLHAWGESHRCFDRLLPALTDDVRAVAIDLRGHGEADQPATGYALAEVADDVVAFMDAVGGSLPPCCWAPPVAVTSPNRWRSPIRTACQA